MFSLLATILMTFLSISSLPTAYAIVMTTTTSAPTQQVVVQRPVIVTTVPAPQENIVIPSGYASCFMVKAGWYQEVWVAEHQVCQYPNSPEGVAWVEGYWMCTKYSLAERQCTNWEWKSAHWEKTLTVY